jgi:hypothetical protein
MQRNEIGRYPFLPKQKNFCVHFSIEFNSMSTEEVPEEVDQIVDYEEGNDAEGQDGDPFDGFADPGAEDEQVAAGETENNEEDVSPTTEEVVIPDTLPEGRVVTILYVSRFHYASTTEPMVREFFEKFGPLKTIAMKPTAAFVEFEKSEDSIKAKYNSHRRPGLGSDSLIVDFRLDYAQQDFVARVSSYLIIVLSICYLDFNVLTYT